MHKIDKKITGYKVVQPNETEEALHSQKTTILDETEKLSSKLPVKVELKRPLSLTSKTYRLKPPQADHALYVTLSALVHAGRRYPFEIFFNTKNPEHIEWTNALTLTISIAFRQAIESGNSLASLIENLKETFGTSGAYLSKVPSKPKFVNGLVAEIGYIIEEFNNECLQYNYSNSSHEVPPTVEETKATFPSEEVTDTKVVTNPCPDCGEQLELLDGCLTCVKGCGWSKCG